MNESPVVRITESSTRSIIVTGGSRGIGRAICIAFADPGTKVYFNYSSSTEAAAETEALIRKRGGEGRGMQVDVTVAAEVKAFVKQVVDETGCIDVLVNNAGIAKDGLIVRMREADWDQVLDINLKGAFNCIKAASRTMLKQQKGRIINIASMVGVSGNAGQANYVASKAGMIGLTKAVAKELGSRHITVNAVAPGYIESEMTASFSDTVKQKLIESIPLGRTGAPEDVARVVKFLASDEAGYITGQVVHVNGGMYM